MAKAGTEYQKIVALVAGAFDPGATVSEGTWIVGPDGRRELDVEVRGTADGVPRFVLIECKDKGRRIGIEAVDALESKSRDLHANAAVLYSNSGFTSEALRKARRVGIQACSALKAGDRRIRVQLMQRFLAKRLSVERWCLTVYLADQNRAEILNDWSPLDLRYGNKPLVNWLAEKSRDLLREHEGASEIRATFAFRQDEQFSLASNPIALKGFAVILFCRRYWVAQEVGVDVTLGLYDHLRGNVTVPDKQGYVLGPFDPHAWTEVDEPDKPEIPSGSEPGTFALLLTLFRPIAPIPGGGIPEIAVLVGEESVEAI